jgi:uncharacterized DUF497 family protein
MKEFAFHRNNLAKHGISEAEAKECFDSGRHRYLRRIGPNRYQLIAKTRAGRYLELIYRESPTERFVFHAMDVHPRDIRLLKRKGKRR